MKVVMLIGGSNTGKTTTLKKLYTILVEKGAKVEDEQPHPNEVDITAKFSYNGKHVYLFTMGDNVYGLQENFDEALNNGFDWFICANSCKLQTYRLLETSELGITLVKEAATDDDEERVINGIINILDHVEIFS